VSDRSLKKGPSKKNKRQRSDDEFVQLVMQKLEDGIKKMKSRKTPFDPFISTQSNAMISKVIEMQAIDSQDEDARRKLLEKLQQLLNAAVEKEEETKSEAGMRQWWYRYYSWCIEMVLHQWRLTTLDRYARAARFIHFIVNDLVPTEGIKSLAVIAALAGKK
jgi:hypothetical protein